MLCRRLSSFELAIAVAIIAAVSTNNAPVAATRDIATESGPDVQLFEGTRFTVQVEGSGPDVILIPGLATPRDVWEGTRASLKGMYRLHIVQIRGFGDPAGINAQGLVLEPFIDELASYIESEIAKKGRKAPALVGHSLGGLSALMIASRHPALTGKVIAVDALPFIGPAFGIATLESIRPQAEALAAATRARPVDTTTSVESDPGPNSQAGFLSKTIAGRTAVARWTRMADARVMAQALYDDMVTDVRPDLGKIAAPITVLYAEDASVMRAGRIDALYATEYAGAPAARLVKISDSRHFIMLDQPEKFQAALAAALAQ